MSHIVRIEYSFGVGFQLRWGDSRGQSKLFTSPVYGSEDRAYLAAKEFQKIVDANINYSIPGKPYKFKGLCLTWMDRASGNRYPYIRGNYKNAEGAHKRANISIVHYGLKEALKKMIELRRPSGVEIPSVDECVEYFTPLLYEKKRGLNSYDSIPRNTHEV